MAKSTTGSENAPAAKSKATLLGWAAAPLPVRRAVRLMLAGAAATFVWGIYWVVVTLGFRRDTVTYYIKVGHLTTSQANSQVNSGVLLIVIQVVVFAAVWVLMARLDRDGHGWARIASTVLFLGWSYRTYSAIYELKQYVGLGDMIIQLAIWGIGCGALVSLWRPEATAYFKGTAVPSGGAKAGPVAGKSAPAKSAAGRSAPAPAKSAATPSAAAKSAPAGKKRR